MLEPLEIAEQRCDLVMRNPESTYDQRLAAVERLARRAYVDPHDAARTIRAWMAETPRENGN